MDEVIHTTEQRLIMSFGYFMAQHYLQLHAGVLVLAAAAVILYAVMHAWAARESWSGMLRDLFSQIALFIVAQLSVQATVDLFGDPGATTVFFLVIIALASYLSSGGGASDPMSLAQRSVFAVSVYFSTFYLDVIRDATHITDRPGAERFAIIVLILFLYGIWLMTIAKKYTASIAVGIITQTVSFVALQLLLSELPQMSALGDSGLLGGLLFALLAIALVIIIERHPALNGYASSIINGAALFAVDGVRGAFLTATSQRLAIFIIAMVFWIALLVELQRISKAAPYRSVIEFIMQIFAGLSVALFLELADVHSSAESSLARSLEGGLSTLVLVPLVLGYLWERMGMDP